MATTMDCARLVAIITMSVTLAACAIEGVGFDGRVNAYRNAAADGREFAALNRGAKDAGWYAGWCAAIKPHFERMSDVRGRVDRYCAAMEAQPDHAEEIRQDLIASLVDGGRAAQESRSTALGALAISAQMQQAQAMQAQAAAAQRPIVVAPSPAVRCNSYRYGNATTTDCQ